ncbi:hypothetical protein [Phaeodactylibacter xiamenensis]|uniref:hypothetical protein n=1 Tax=Phaeodactylibacter xiamenensis TaxID=1524460 RepID=UPI0024A7E6DC|nr:hypothetical protein [Phaeodactylibacter xiamenensis]
MIQNQKAILEAFLNEALADKGLSLDEKSLNVINNNLELNKRPLPENEQRRLLKLSEDTSGKKKAESIKLANLLELSIHEILVFIGKEMGILLFDDTPKRVLYGLGMLILEFIPSLTLTFSDQEAEVLFAIARLGNKEFTTNDVGKAYQEAIQKSLPEDRLEASLEKLVQLRVLRRTDVKAYELKEKIKNLKR